MEGRKCCIYLPNDRKLELTIQSKQLGKDLLDIVALEYKIKERDYFGLAYKAIGEHYAWIQEDKKVLDHDLEQKSTNQPLEFTFSVKFYEDSVTVLKHSSTVELFFLHARYLIYKGEIEVPGLLSLNLASLALQAIHGDFTSELEASSHFKKLPCIPSKVLKDIYSFEDCEREVVALYRELEGVTRGQAVLTYMSKVETLASYGIHYFKVRDKSRIPWWLGISNKGISQYNFNDKVNPHIVFQWRNLENLYFREKKFSVEVCAGHRHVVSSGLSPSGKEKKKTAGNNQQTPKSHTWYGSPSLIKSIWIMAIAQHQFYWDRKQSSKKKSNQVRKSNTSYLCNELNRSEASLLEPANEIKNMQRKNVKNVEVTLKKGSKEQSPEMRALQQKMLENLKKRKLDLEDRLYDKVQELKEVCRQEYDITERLPIEYVRYLLPGEQKPQLRRRVGAEYAVTLNRKASKGLSSTNFKSSKSVSGELEQLESECELLNQITKAAYDLTRDSSARGRTKRKRFNSYKKSLKKLQELENRIAELSKQQGIVPGPRASAFITDEDLMKSMRDMDMDNKSERSSLSEGMLLDDEASLSSGAEALSTHSTPALSYRPNSESADVDIGEYIEQRSKTPPPPRNAWPASPSRSARNQEKVVSSNNSYPVLPSPMSSRSNPSPGSSRSPIRPVSKRDWVKPKHENSRHNHEWKVSSLDSLESFSSRPSTEPGNTSDLVGSPTADNAKNFVSEENANTLRVARPIDSPSHAHKVNLRDKRQHSEQSRRMGTVNPVVDIIEGTNLKDSKDNSRTSLTDSGHITSSEYRISSGQENNSSRQHRNVSSIKREVSDSSLSELSTQSNPAALPSSGHHPKFYPYFMTSRAPVKTQGENSKNGSKKAKVSNQESQGSLRKRSSSFTESNSHMQKVTLRRGTLSRSKTHNSDEGVSRNAVQLEVDADGTLRIEKHGDTEQEERYSSDTSKSNHCNSAGIPMSHSAQDLPTPMFDTNRNIYMQYLSQGQLTQSNISTVQANIMSSDFHELVGSKSPDDSTLFFPEQYKPISEQEQAWSDLTASISTNAQRYRYNTSANNSNQATHTVNTGGSSKKDMKRYNSHPHEHSNAVPMEEHPGTFLRHNSLDSVLDNRVNGVPVNIGTLRNISTESQNLQQQTNSNHNQYHAVKENSRPGMHSESKLHHYQEASHQEQMTSYERDQYNNQAYEDIRGMGWVPSLNDYGSRASVAESLPAKSKKEDIMELLTMHIANHWKPPKRTPSTSSSATSRAKVNLQLRAKIRAEMMREKDSKIVQKSTQCSKATESGDTWEEFKRKQYNTDTNRHPQQMQNQVNIFRHNPPPPVNHFNERSQPHRSDNQDISSNQESHPARQIHKGYVDRNGFVIPMVQNDTLSDIGSYNYPSLHNGSSSSYNTMRNQKTTYPPYTSETNPNPFERSFHSATLPRHYAPSPMLQQHSVNYPELKMDNHQYSPQSIPYYDYPNHRLTWTNSHIMSSGTIHNTATTVGIGLAGTVQRYQRQTPYNTSQHDPQIRYAPPYAPPLHTVQTTGDPFRNPSNPNIYSGTHMAERKRHQMKPQVSHQNNPPAMLQQHRGKQKGYPSTSKGHTDGNSNNREQEGIPNQPENGNSQPKTHADTPVVIQACRTIPGGQKVSVFTVTKSAPNTPLPQRKNAEKGKGFKDSDDSDDTNATITNDSLDRTLSPLNIMRNQVKATSDSDAVIVHTPNFQTPTDMHLDERGVNKKSSINTDTMQAIAIESARQAQKKFRSSKDNLAHSDSSKPPPALPLSPPNASTRRSSKESGNRLNDNEKSRNKIIPHKTLSSKYDEVRSRATESRSSPRPARSRSKTRAERSGSEPKTSNMSENNTPTCNDDNRFYGLNSYGEKTKKQIPIEEKCKPPGFQRTLSTPTRSMKFTLPAGGAGKANCIPSRTKPTGMYEESLKGSNPRNLPPPGQRSHRQVSAQTPQPGQNSILSKSSVNQSRCTRPIVITQSGTLPRTPKSRKRLDRSGSTSASLVAAPPVHFSNDQMPSSIPSYFHTKRQEPFNRFRVDEDSRFRRSMSETWNQQGLLPTMMSHHHLPLDRHKHVYQHMGHHGMMSAATEIMQNDAPRRTASADDLLGGPDAIAYNINNQRGTLV